MTHEWIAVEERLPGAADQDHRGDVLWLRSGGECLGRVACGCPVDATHWRRTGAEGRSPSTEKRAIVWLLSEDTGASSESILAHMLGVPRYADYPSDVGDLGRCLRLLEQFPAWARRMGEMAVHGPGWAGLVGEWDSLAGLMSEEVGIAWEKGKSAPRTSQAMKLAIANGFRNDPNYECRFSVEGYLESASRRKQPGGTELELQGDAHE
jgi:hypothetical protein